MVGYAYSLDFSLGYEYILIKAYNCDSLSLVNSGTAYEVYRVNRHNMSVSLVLPKDGTELFHLNLSYIQSITDMLTVAEYESRYPVSLSWTITPSGNCIKTNTKDLLTSWPIYPYMWQSDEVYINITGLSFKKNSSYLEVSFCADVLNELAYLCGIYSSEPFMACGNALCCSSVIAAAEHKIFKTKKLSSLCLGIIPFEISKSKIKPRHILSKLRKLSYDHGEYGSDISVWLVNIKRECMADIAADIINCIQKGFGIDWLWRRIKHRLFKSLDVLLNLGTELMWRSSIAASSDIKYLSFDELHMAFTFADAMRDISKNIQRAKLRKRALNKLNPPALIYKGRFFYK